MFTLNDIVQGNIGKVQLYGKTTPDSNLLFSSAHHDSRQITSGDLFVAIKGARVDGHTYIPTVARAGALAALCTTPSEDVPADFLQIVVPDVVAALQATAHQRVQRQQQTIFLGITGSNGKTSTKDAIATVLGHKAPTLKTLGSYNNEIGYPLTLLRLEPEQRYAVLEMGAQWVGELAGLCRTVARPTWSMITNVGTAHLEYFGSQERIAIAKGELVEALSEEGIALLNYDDLKVRAMSARTRARILYYGRGEEADVRASAIQASTLLDRGFTLHYQGREQRIQLHLPGEHGVTIALAAAAAGLAAEMSLDEVANALTELVPSPGRGQIKTGPAGSVLIDDTYNANRQSIVAITSAMRETPLPSDGKRWAVLGDIFELGPYSHEEHYNTGVAVAAHVDYLVAVGEQARLYVEGARAAGMAKQQTYYFQADPQNNAEMAAAREAIAELLKHDVHSNDLLLLKGSRGMHMESIIDLL